MKTVRTKSVLARPALGAIAITVVLAAPAIAGMPGIGGMLSGILGRASDGALDKLSQPGAFYSDSAIRIGLPGIGGIGGGGGASSLLGMAEKAGIGGGLSRSINDAAGLAAKEAKPIFRTAISNMTIADVPGIATQNDGATQYLKRTAGVQLRGKMRPLIVSALGQTGAFSQLGKLGAGGIGKSVGLDQDGLTNSVTDQALKGIYSYMGKEEAGLRANPIGKGSALLNGLVK